LKRRFVYLLLIAIASALLLFFNQQNGGTPDTKANDSGYDGRRSKPDPAGDVQNRGEPLNRRASDLIYTKHARCRMKCRHIDDSEVKEILENGRINYDKSEPAGRPDPKFALEGRTHDNQYVRIIFAPADRGMVVITVIDLEKEWSCDCK
jgi:hypothetical protein